MAIRLLIADDHEIVRIGLRATFDEDFGMEVVAEAIDGVSALSKSLETNPDIVLMDIKMPRMDGIQATRKLKENLPQLKVLILTSNDSREDIFAAFAAGADGYCMKDIPSGQLVQAIHSVFGGAAWIDPQLARVVLDSALAKAPVSARKVMDFNLSARELEVLGLLVQGLNNSDIAKKLVLSPETVKSHMRHILAKLEVSDRTQAAMKAMREGLV